MSKKNIIGLKTKDKQLMNLLTIEENNINIIDKQNSIEINTSDDYTAFEVMPNKVIISAGTIDDVTKLTYNYEIDICTIHKMTLRSAQEPEDCDVVIDWGDGTIESIKDGNYISHTTGKSYELSHDYSAQMTEDIQRFIIKIYGKDYYTFRHNSYVNNTLISRIFEADLPIASHISNFASMARNAQRLLSVKLQHSTKTLLAAHNWSSVFHNCNNLISATGFGDNKLADDCLVYSLFFDCWSLKTTDFIIPPGSYSLHSIFYNCQNLEADINKLLPIQGFQNPHMYAEATFYNTQKLTGIIPSHILWNAECTWDISQGSTTNKNLPFQNSSLVSQVPVRWGGTNNRIDTELAITDEIKLDYTAFEVLAHDYDITSGMVNEDTGYTYGYDVPACMTHKMILRSTVSQDKQDIIIDWGDETELDFLVNGKFDSMSGTDYYVSHTYETPGKYIVKIYGKQYFAIKYHSKFGADENYNLICRVFDYDLPVASHIVNFSSFCYNAKRLQKVAIPKYSEFVSRAINFGSIFRFCHNLVSVKGFDTYTNPALYACDAMFVDCNILETCDFKIPSYMIADNINYIFCNTCKLSEDINNILPAQGFNVDKMSVTNMFSTCTSLTGTVPADILWNDKTVEWRNTSNAFLNSSNEIRAQVPVSWGGTNSNIDAELAITDEMKADYTAFEVMPNSVQIKASTSDTTYFGTNEKPEIIKRAIAANTTHIMFIRSKHAPSEQDVIIDWGDSNFTKLSDGINSNDCYYVTDTENPSEYVYYLKHDYADALTDANLTFNRYIVKIYGKNYFGIKYTNAQFTDKNGETVTITSPTTAIYNLISRVFESDLPIASHIINLSSFCYAATRLIRVNVQINQQFDNLGNIFQSCGNLLSATGLNRLIKNTSILSNMFASCKFLETVDLKMPAATTSIAGLFNACENLSVDIIDLLPSAKFNSLSINVSNAFRMCRKLTCSDTEMLGQYFWNNHNVSWTNISTAFVEPYVDIATNLIIEHIPVSWGGTASDNIINPTVDEKLANKADLDYSGKILTSQLPDGYGESDLIIGTTEGTAFDGARGLALETAIDNKADLVDGKIPSTQLPSYVDDVIEGYYSEPNFYSDSSLITLITAESSKIYVDLNTNISYRWSGTQYIEISSSLTLGETSSTAFPGDRGKALEGLIGDINAILDEINGEVL